MSGLPFNGGPLPGDCKDVDAACSPAANQPHYANECKFAATDLYMFRLAVRAHNRADVSPFQGFAIQWGACTQGDASLALGCLLRPPLGK